MYLAPIVNLEHKFEVRVFVVPQLQQILAREGALPSWTRVGRFAGSRAASNPAVALLEMALLDRELRATNTSIDTLWPVHFDTPLQATVSLIDDVTFDVHPSTARVRARKLRRVGLLSRGDIAQVLSWRAVPKEALDLPPHLRRGRFERFATRVDHDGPLWV